MSLKFGTLITCLICQDTIINLFKGLKKFQGNRQVAKDINYMAKGRHFYSCFHLDKELTPLVKPIDIEDVCNHNALGALLTNTFNLKQMQLGKTFPHAPTTFSLLGC